MKHVTRAAVMAVALIALALPAGASAEPAPGFEEFADCPSRAVNPNLQGCVATRVDGGHLKLGSKTTPITDPITLVVSTTRTGETVVGSFDGGRQRVPGGLTGLTGLDWLSWLFPFSMLAIDAEAELAGTPSSPAVEPLHLPLKVRLINPLLSSSCYIGSNADPINLVLTTGTTNPPPPNQPITGTGSVAYAEPGNPRILRLRDGVLVDNAFAVPHARGCDLLGVGLVDVLVNAQAGLPSPAGNNEAVQEFSAAIAPLTAIYPPSGIDQ